jgi:hypothetical protein
MTQPDIAQIIELEHAKVAKKFTAPGDDRYRFAIPELGVTFEVDRVRRDGHELWGELSVLCSLPGARTVNGSLSIADFNFSSARSRQDRAKLLGTRCGAKDLDWNGLVEELCQRVLQADRAGQPAVDLRTLARPSTDDDMLVVEGLALPRRHPSIAFGDGGAGKSYLGLYLGGRIAEKGIPVMLADWELAGEDHRDRLERLFPDGMPRILYVRCERPLVYEVDRLRRIVRDNGIEFTVFDSVAFACDGPPEAAEIAGKYFRAVRQIGGGSLHVAHVSKGENADQKPFGSAFWHNGARSTWYVKQDEASAGTDVLRIGLFNRKTNLGKLRQPLGYSITFGEETTTFRRTDVAASPDLADKLSLPQKMAYLLRSGSKTMKEIADELDAKQDTVKKAVYRNQGRFIVLDDGSVGLLERVR